MLLDLSRIITGRRFFWTRSGFMGIGPAAAKANDTICVLFGGQVLYVIRAKDGERHEFIGECYVHGFMDGEAVEGCDTEGGPQSQTFILT